jgi:hypothetical protein
MPGLHAVHIHVRSCCCVAAQFNQQPPRTIAFRRCSHRSLKQKIEARRRVTCRSIFLPTHLLPRPAAAHVVPDYVLMCQQSRVLCTVAHRGGEGVTAEFLVRWIRKLLRGAISEPESLTLIVVSAIGAEGVA